MQDGVIRTPENQFWEPKIAVASERSELTSERENVLFVVGYGVLGKGRNAVLFLLLSVNTQVPLV